ncbi:glycosyltransferase family 2 protein [Pseudocolwellia agarivorans]|uniref:glycosyltransferase family 2 protein n=1 Tax=Pseudocolwellia agarivorans TaxID=1911682 RepID=UPI003F885AAC
MPFFSIIIPAYNAEEYIERCLNSVFDQNFDDYELIIVNDGSTDKTKELIESLKHCNKAIKLVNQDNAGVSVARNKGLSLATGKYILFLDSDDWVLPGYLLFLNEEFNLHSHDGIILAHYTSYGKALTKEENHLALQGFHEINGYTYGYLFLQKLITNSPCDKVFLRELYLKDELKFPESVIVGEDAVVMSSLGLSAIKIGIYSEGFLVYMRNTNGITKSKANIRQLIDISKSVNYICNRFEGKYEEGLISYMAFRQLIFYILNCPPNKNQLVEFNNHVLKLNPSFLPNKKWKIIHFILKNAVRLSLLPLLIKIKIFLHKIKT